MFIVSYKIISLKECLQIKKKIHLQHAEDNRRGKQIP